MRFNPPPNRPITTRLALAVAALPLVLAGCSSGAHPAAAGGPAVKDLPSLAAKLGCTFVEETNTHEIYTSDQGDCGDLTLRWFNGSAARDSWTKFASQFGGNMLIGEHWIATSDAPGPVKSAQAVAGGDLK